MVRYFEVTGDNPRWQIFLGIKHGVVLNVNSSISWYKPKVEKNRKTAVFIAYCRIQITDLTQLKKLIETTKVVVNYCNPHNHSLIILLSFMY